MITSSMIESAKPQKINFEMQISATHGHLATYIEFFLLNQFPHLSSLQNYKIKGNNLQRPKFKSPVPFFLVKKLSAGEEPRTRASAFFFQDHTRFCFSLIWVLGWPTAQQERQELGCAPGQLFFLNIRPRFFSQAIAWAAWAPATMLPQPLHQPPPPCWHFQTGALSGSNQLMSAPSGASQ